MLPTGIRNNNPGNIRHSNIKWHGMSAIQTDPNFVQFETAEDGLRALIKNLINKQALHGLNTIRKIIGDDVFGWAPASENDTAGYIKAVSIGLNIDPDQPLDLHRVGMAVPFAKEIVRHENGEPPGMPWYPHFWYSDATYAQAFADAA